MAREHGYRIWFDDAHSLLRWQLSGFWTIDTVAAFATALREASRAAGRTCSDYHCLNDSRNLPVQSIEVMTALHDLTERGMRYGRRQAIVVRQMLNKIQADRYLRHPQVRVFLEENAALAWLAEGRGSPPIPLMNGAFPPGSVALP